MVQVGGSLDGMNAQKFLVAATALVLIAGGVSACAGSSSTDQSTAQSSAQSSSQSSTQALGPIIKDPSLLAGNEVTVPLLRILVLDVDSEPEKWTATVADPTIAEFTPASNDGSAEFTPGFQPLAEGSTEVTVTSPSGEEYTFTLIVTPGAR